MSKMICGLKYKIFDLLSGHSEFFVFDYGGYSINHYFIIMRLRRKIGILHHKRRLLRNSLGNSIRLRATMISCEQNLKGREEVQKLFASIP